MFRGEIVLAGESSAREFQEQVRVGVATDGGQQKVGPRPDQKPRDDVDAVPDRREQDGAPVPVPDNRDAENPDEDHPPGPGQPDHAPRIEDFSQDAGVLLLLVIVLVDGQYELLN